MLKLHQSIFINAPKEKVWDTMLSPDTYKLWTVVFNPGSRYEGNFEVEGSEIKFLGTDENGVDNQGGMYSKIKEIRKYEFVSIEHIGIITNGVIDTTSDEVKKWAPSFENYTFVEKDGGTEVIVDMDISEEFKNEFDGMWQKALQKLKEICE